MGSHASREIVLLASYSLRKEKAMKGDAAGGKCEILVLAEVGFPFSSV